MPNLLKNYIFANFLNVKGHTAPANTTIRKYLTALATYSLPKRAVSGAERPDLIARIMPRPIASFRSCAYHFALVSKLMYFESTK